jgi:hypothetical protein
MRIDQAGHQRASAKIDPLGACARDRAFRYLADAAGLDEHAHIFAQIIRLAVKQTRIVEEDGAHAWVPSGGKKLEDFRGLETVQSCRDASFGQPGRRERPNPC